MEIKFILNGKKMQVDAAPDLLLLDLLREKGCYQLRPLYCFDGQKAGALLQYAGGPRGRT